MRIISAQSWSDAGVSSPAQTLCVTAYGVPFPGAYTASARSVSRAVFMVIPASHRRQLNLFALTVEAGIPDAQKRLVVFFPDNKSICIGRYMD